MKKLLHLSAQLFTTLLFLFAFPQVGRGDVILRVDDLNSFYSINLSSSTPTWNPSTPPNTVINMYVFTDDGSDVLTNTILQQVADYSKNFNIMHIFFHENCNMYWQYTSDVLNFKLLNLKQYRNLREITCPHIAFVSQPTKVDMSEAFADCKSLVRIHSCASTFLNYNITNLAGAFKNCASLESVTFSSTNESQNVDCTEAFMGCKALTGVENFEKIKASSLKNAFNGCSKLEKIELGFATSGFNAGGLVGTFNGCSNLQYADLSGAPNNINSLNNTFYGCKSLKYVYLPKNTTNGVNLNYTFAGCNFAHTAAIKNGYAVNNLPDTLWWYVNDCMGSLRPCYGLNLDLDDVAPYHIIYDEYVQKRPTPFITCGLGKNIEVIKDGATIYLLKKDPYNEHSATNQTIKDPEFIVQLTEVYSLTAAYSSISEVVNDGYDVPVVVKDPPLASPATFYLSNSNGMFDINERICIANPPNLSGYDFSSGLKQDINKKTITSNSITIFGDFHLTTNKSNALRDDSNTPIQVEISELPGEYYLVPNGSTVGLVEDITGPLNVSTHVDVNAQLKGDGADYFCEPDADYGLCKKDEYGTIASEVGYTHPETKRPSIYYFPIPKDRKDLFPAHFAETPVVSGTTPPDQEYYIQDGCELKNGALEPKWKDNEDVYCGIYNINQLQNISSMVGTFDGCTTLVFGVDNGTKPDKIGGSAGNFSSTQKNDARLNCTAAFRGVKSFGTFKNAMSWTAIDLTMFKDIESLNSTFWNGGTKVKFYDAQDKEVDMQHAFHGNTNTSYTDTDPLVIPFKNISSLVAAFCSSDIGFVEFNLAPQNQSCNMQEAFRYNRALSNLAHIKNFDRFKKGDELLFTFANCSKLSDINGLEISTSLRHFTGTFAYNKFLSVDMSPYMNRVAGMKKTFVGCGQLNSCKLGATVQPISMCETFRGCSKLQNLIDFKMTVNDLANTFNNCQVLETVNLTDIDAVDPIALRATFAYCYKLQSVTFSDALTKALGKQSTWFYSGDFSGGSNPQDACFYQTFFGCTNLQTVTFAAVSNTNEIGMPQTFSGCKKLQKVENLNAFKRLTDLNQTFSGCEQLGSVEFDINSIDHEVKHLYRTFFNCKNIQKINLGSISKELTDADCNPKNLTKQTLAFGQTFFGCEALKTVTFGSEQNSNPVSMCGTFYGCAKLTGLTNIDKFTNITNLSQTFSGCKALTGVDLSKAASSAFDCTSPITIGLFETFKGCKNITSIDLSGLTARLADQTNANFFQANNNDIINGAFAAFEGTFDGCTALTDVEFDKGISDGTSTNPLINANSIGMPGTFSGCANLQTVKNLTAFQNLTQLNHTFYGCRQLDGIQFSISNAHAAPMSLFGTFTNCSALTEITLPFVIGEQSIFQTRGNTTSSVTYSAFGDNPSGDNPNKTFAGCTSLKKVEFLSSGSASKVNLDNLFLNLSSLQYVINFNFSDVKNGSLENTFSGCSALLKEDPNINYELTLPKANGQTMLLKNTFNGCTALAEMRLRYSGYQAEGLVGTFRGCTSLTLVELVSSKSAVSMEDAFNGCSNLQQVNNFVGLTNVTSLVRTFADCKQLATLEFGFNPTNLASADETFNGTNSDCTKRLQCDWDRHQWWIDEYTNNKTASYNPNSFIFEDRSATTPEIVFDCDMFDVKPKLEADGNRVVEFVNVVKDGTAYTPDATGKYLVAGTDTCGAITVTATQITDITLTASGTYDFHYRTENSGKGHCNKQATIALTLGHSDKHEVSDTICEDANYEWRDANGNLIKELTPTDYNAPVSAAPPTNGSRLKLSKGSAIIDATGKKSRQETYKYYKQVENIAGNKCEESSTLTLTVRLLDTITTTVTAATCVCPDLSYAWTVENGNIITIDESAFGGAATSALWTRTDNQNGSVMFEHKGLDTSDPQSCNTVYQLVFEKPHTPIDITQTITTTHCQEYAYQWDLTPDNPDDDEYLTLSGADFDPTSTAWKLSVNAINSPSHTYDTSKDNLILDSKRTQSAIVNEMVTYMFTVKLKNANTCVDTYTLNLPVKLTHRNEQTDTICEDANYEWRDNAGKMITTLDKSDFGQCLGKSQYGKYQPLTHDPALDIEKMVVRTYTDNGRRFREEIYKYYAQRENCAEGKCEISDSLILTVELVDIIKTEINTPTCVCPDLSYAWTVENDAVITLDERAFAPNATSALWTRIDNQNGSVTFEHSGTINGHLCATVYQLIFDNPTKPINDEKTDKTCESEFYKWDLGSSGAAIALSGNDFVNAPTWTVSAFTSSETYSAVTSAERTLKAQLPATEQMTFTYKVTLFNNQTACEDTYTLDLTVQQTHREQTTAQVCANVDYELKNTWGEVVLTLGENEYSMGNVAANPFSTAGGSGTFSKTILPGGTQRYVVSKTGGTRYGCLEEYTLDLTVNPVYDERPGGPDAANATTGTVCQNEDFVWNIAGDALVSAITLTYADYNQTATAFNSAGQQLQLDKTTNGTTQCYTYKGADNNTHCDRFYYLTLTVSPVIDQTLYSPYTDATQMAYCSDQTYVWNDGGFSYYLDSVQFYRPDGVYTENGITIEQTTISATPWIVQFVATVPSGSCQAKYKLLLALDDRFAANLVLANTVADAVCNGSSYVWNYGSGESVTVSPTDLDYPTFPVGGRIKRRVSVPGASGCNDYYYLDLTINPSDHRTMTIDAVCRDENYFSYTGFPINEIVDFDAAELPADVKSHTHTVAHDCDQMTITFNFKEPERCQGKIVEGLVVNQYECWLLMVNHNHLPLLDQEPVAYQWYVCHNTAPGDPNFLRNSNPIDGANKDFYTETQTLTGGYYWVKVTYIVGGEEFYYRSEPAALTCTDALEVVTTTELMLSPNPVKQGSVVVVEGDAIDKMADGAHVDIYTTAGQRVRSFDIGGRAFKVDVPAGCYMVKISVDGQTIVTTKMVVR